MGNVDALSLVWKRLLRNSDRGGCSPAHPGLVLHKTCLEDYLADVLTDKAEVTLAVLRLQALGLVDIEYRADWNVFDDAHPVLRIREWRRIKPKRRSIPNGVRQAVYERDGCACIECGGTDELTLDHIVPWSRDGADTEDNLQTMCRSCNCRKGAGD